MLTELRRTLGLWDLILLAVGTAIGSGVFLSASTVIRQTHAMIAAALGVWMVGGVLSLLGALTYAELSAQDPEAGGIYVYIRDAFGALPAFVYGWALFFAIGTGSLATLAVAAAVQLESVVSLGAVGAKLVALAVIAGATVVNVLGTREAVGTQNGGTLIKGGAILLMSAALIALGHGYDNAAGHVWPAHTTGGFLSDAGLAMIGVLWAYEGWQWVTFSAGETKDPQRTFPRGIVLGTLLLATIYVLANVGYIAALGPERAAASTNVAADAVRATLGAGATRAVVAMVLVAIVSAAVTIPLTMPRVFYAMARDGVFFHRLSEVHPRFGTPAFAIVASSAWTVVLALSGTFETLLSYVVFVAWIFYALGAASIFVFRRRAPDAPRPYRVPGYPLTPLVFVLTAGAIVLNTIVGQPRTALIGLGIVATGIPAFYIWKALGTQPAASSKQTDLS